MYAPLSAGNAQRGGRARSVFDDARQLSPAAPPMRT
jgi:hypothetical protein